MRTLVCIVCIEPYDNQHITYGTEYTVSRYDLLDAEWVEIINNEGLRSEYLRRRFVTKEEWREMKLKELGI